MKKPLIWGSHSRRRPPLHSDGLRTSLKARLGSRLAPCLRGYGESNPTPLRLSPMDHRRFGIAALAPRMATVGMKIQASRSPLSERPEVRFCAVHAARFHRASLSLETDLVRSTEGARHSPSGLDGNREATTGRGNIARPILTTRRREASRRRFLPSATARSQTTWMVRSRGRSPKPVHAGTRVAACRRGLSREHLPG